MDLEILNIASDTVNNRKIINHTHYSKLKNSICGDEIKIMLVIKDNKITEFGYQGNSCIYCQASASLLSKISINNPKDKIDILCDTAYSYFNGNLETIKKEKILFKKLFKKKNLPRKDCILLPFKAFRKIVSDSNNV